MPLLTAVLLALTCAAFVMAVALLIRGALYRPVRPLLLVVAARKDSAGDLFTLTLRRSGLARLWPLPCFAAGQSVALLVPGEAVKRRYSIARWCRLPFAYEISIKREPQGRFSSRLADYAVPGARLMVGRPDGHFTLPALSGAQRAVLIAGGVGITPMLAMLDQWSTTRRPYSEMHLYWQVRHEEEALYREALAALAHQHPGLKVRLLVSRPAQGQAEKISAGLLNAELAGLADTDFYLCAGADLLDAMLAALHEAGVAEDALHFERFSLGGPVGADEGWTISCAGRQFPYAGHASLLDAMEGQGLAMDADCRTGSCGRCLVAVEQGQAMHRIAPEYEVPAGHVLACCAVPKSDLRLRAVTAHSEGVRA